MLCSLCESSSSQRSCHKNLRMHDDCDMRLSNALHCRFCLFPYQSCHGNRGAVFSRDSSCGANASGHWREGEGVGSNGRGVQHTAILYTEHVLPSPQGSSTPSFILASFLSLLSPPSFSSLILSSLLFSFLFFRSLFTCCLRHNSTLLFQEAYRQLGPSKYHKTLPLRI